METVQGLDKPRNVWPEAKLRWSECAAGFDCLCGEPDFVISDEPVTCHRCGRVYRLSALFTVQEQPH